MEIQVYECFKISKKLQGHKGRIKAWNSVMFGRFDSSRQGMINEIKR